MTPGGKLHMEHPTPSVYGMLSSHWMHVVAPLAAAKVFSAQAVHAVAPPLDVLYQPGVHAMHSAVALTAV